MEMRIPKGITALLPLAGSMLPFASAAGALGIDLKQTDEKRATGFFEKLAAAIDKPESSEPVDQKKAEKPIADGKADTLPDAIVSGIPVGLVWSLPIIGMDVPAENDTVVGKPANAVSSGQEGFVNVMPQNNSSLAMAAFTRTEPTGISPSVFKQVAPLNPEALMQSAALPVENAAAVPTENAAVVKNEQTNPTVSQFVQVNSFRTDSPKNMTIKLPETVELSVTPAPPEMNGSPVKSGAPDKFGTPVISETPVSGPTGVNSATRLIDPAILEDIASMQVATSATINNGQAVSATSPKAEAAPVDMKPEPVLGVTGESPEPSAVPAAEIELPKKSLGQTASELFLKSADKTDSAVFAPVAFDSVLKSVEQAPVPSAVAAQPRPDLHEVARQVMDGMSASTDRLKSSQVIITLKPEHLGEVTVKINVDGDRVTAAFHAASSEVRAILESSLPQLRQEMSRQGWSFDSNGVFGGMHEFLSNQQHQQQKAQEQQMLQFANRAQRDEYDDSAAFTNNGRLKVMSATAVDYRI